MSFDWANFLPLARELYAQGSQPEDEAKLRCAIGRAYYAAFGKACDFLRDEGENIPEHNAHFFVWNTFGMYDDDTRLDISDYGKKLSAKRKRADYAAHCGRIKDEADDAINNAEVLIHYLDQLATQKAA